jgi:hypothetical protein
MKNGKTKAMPVIGGGDWNHFTALRQYLSNLPVKHEINELQLTAILGNAHTHTHTQTHTAGSANVKARNIFRGRNNITCSTNCKYRTAATPVPYPEIFFRGGGGVQQIKLTEGRANRDLGGGSPLVRGSAQFANG